MSKFGQWCLKIAMKSLAKLDKNGDGIITIEVDYDLDTKKIDYKIQ